VHPSIKNIKKERKREWRSERKAERKIARRSSMSSSSSSILMEWRACLSDEQHHQVAIQPSRKLLGYYWRWDRKKTNPRLDYLPPYLGDNCFHVYLFHIYIYHYRQLSILIFVRIEKIWTTNMSKGFNE
jgi:hypothetical protein